jgi:hypothetical protein
MLSAYAPPPPFQLLNHLTCFPKLGIKTMPLEATPVLYFGILQSIVATWQMYELLWW